MAMEIYMIKNNEEHIKFIMNTYKIKKEDAERALEKIELICSGLILMLNVAKKIRKRYGLLSAQERRNFRRKTKRPI